MMISPGPASAGSSRFDEQGRRVSRRARRGITIIEVLVVLTGVAAMLGLCAVTIQLLLRLNADGQARLSASAALDRLATQFREDVHACDAAELVEKAAGKPDGAAATLRTNRGPQLVITYEARDGRIARVESDSGKASRHESYLLDRGSAVHFERRDDGPRRFVAMVVSRRAGKDQPDPPRSLEVLALEGKDRSQPSRREGDKPR
jgi:hypothetical protein